MNDPRETIDDLKDVAGGKNNPGGVDSGDTGGRVKSEPGIGDGGRKKITPDVSAGKNNPGGVDSGDTGGRVKSDPGTGDGGRKKIVPDVSAGAGTGAGSKQGLDDEFGGEKKRTPRTN